MTKLLLRLFIRGDGRENVTMRHASIGKLAGVVGIVCNCLLFLAKLILGLVAGSVSIVADAVNNLSDASSSIITVLGFHMAQRPADEHHPYGHARYEYLSGFVVATMILVIGFELARSSVDKIIHPSPVDFTNAAIAIMLGSILVKLWMALFYRRLGKMIQSTTLYATSADSRNDVIATAAVLIGCLINRFFGVNVDGWMGLMVALFILYSGVSIAKDTISPLLGKQADGELLERISSLILEHDRILGIHDLLVHDYGPGSYFASVHVELSADEDPQICHDIIDDIECDAMRELNVHLVIHYDPVNTCDEELNEMRGVMEEIVREIDPQLSMHDLRIIRGGKQTRLSFDLAVPYAMSDRHDALKQQIDEALAARDKHYKTIIRFDGTA